MIKAFGICFIMLFTISCFYLQPSQKTTSAIPSGSPFIPADFIITAYFHDPGYFKIFHKQHTGIDLIPAKFIPDKPVILYATLSGIGYYASDPCSGNAVMIQNDQFIAYYGHVASYLFADRSFIQKHQQIAIMGESGKFGVCVTGIHVHYQLYEKIGSVFTIIDPLPYLQ